MIQDIKADCEEKTTTKTKDHHRSLILSSYKESSDAYEDFTRDKKRFATTNNTAQKERLRRKLENSKHILHQLKVKFHELHNDYPWMFECTFDDKCLGRFDVTFVDQVVGPLVRAPSTVTLAIMAMSIKLVVERVIFLEKNSFLTTCGKKELYCFLDPEKDRYHRAIDGYLRSLSSLQGMDVILKCPYAFFHYKYSFLKRLVAEEKPLDTLWGIMRFQGGILCHSKIFCWGVTREQAEPGSSSWNQHYKLAERVFKTSSSIRDFSMTSTRESFTSTREKFFQRREKYLAILRAIQRYTNDKATKAFLAVQGPPEHLPSQTFTRQDAIDSLFTKLNYPSERLLERGDHRTLLLTHKAMFRCPRQYGISPF